MLKNSWPFKLSWMQGQCSRTI